MRVLIVGGLGSADKHEGDETKLLSTGEHVKIGKRRNYNLDPKKAESAQLQLPDDLAGEMIGWKPKLSVGTYRKAAPEWQAIVEPALTITPGTPTLEIVYPSKDRLI